MKSGRTLNGHRQTFTLFSVGLLDKVVVMCLVERHLECLTFRLEIRRLLLDRRHSLPSWRCETHLRSPGGPPKQRRNSSRRLRGIRCAEKKLSLQVEAHPSHREKTQLAGRGTSVAQRKNSARGSGWPHEREKSAEERCKCFKCGSSTQFSPPVKSMFQTVCRGSGGRLTLVATDLRLRSLAC